MNVKHHFLGRGNYLLSPCPVTSSYWDKLERGAGRSGSFLLCTSATFHISLLVLPLLTSTSLLLDLEREQHLKDGAGASFSLRITTRAGPRDCPDSQTHQVGRAAVSEGSSKCQELLNKKLCQKSTSNEFFPSTSPPEQGGQIFLRA